MHGSRELRSTVDECVPEKLPDVVKTHSACTITFGGPSPSPADACGQTAVRLQLLRLNCCCRPLHVRCTAEEGPEVHSICVSMCLRHVACIADPAAYMCSAVPGSGHAADSLNMFSCMFG